MNEINTRAAGAVDAIHQALATRGRRELRTRAAPAVAATDDESGRNVVYVHTRRLAVDPEHLRRNRVISGLNDPCAALYSVLRTKVAQTMRDNGWRSLVITSPDEGEGKTLTAVNLAISLAREVGKNVLLVDLDLRRPRLLRHFTNDTLPGMGEFLCDDAPVHGLLINPGIEGLVILPGSRSLQNAAEMLTAPKMAALVKELGSRYPDRLVLFDMPPVLLCDDVLAFSPFFDAALVVSEEGGTSKEQLRRALALLDKANVLGTVVNKSRRPQSLGRYYSNAS